MDGISQKVDAALANQRLIIDCLRNNGFLNRLSSTRSSVPEAAGQNRINFIIHLTNHNTMLEMYTCSRKRTYNCGTRCFEELREKERDNSL
ncbi:Hypothetical predicted protein, partial [Paramuricea clavata]